MESPNSKTNTCIFCAFLAYDSVTNLHIALDRFSDQVNNLQTMKWCNENTIAIISTFTIRDKSIRVFLAGDYELICKMYGLSGASGIKNR